MEAYGRLERDQHAMSAPAFREMTGCVARVVQTPDEVYPDSSSLDLAVHGKEPLVIL